MKQGIAIIGMSCQFPGAPDLRAYWDLLANGREGLTRFSEEELAKAGIPPSVFQDPNYVPVGGRLKQPTHFDAGFFGYSKREAKIMDPQHRLFLEHSWKALEHAGYSTEAFPGAIGVFAGSAMNTYLVSELLPAIQKGLHLDPVQALVGADKDFLTTRASYKLNLRGPSLNLQTACSTSLAAVHIACESLFNFESDIALAGGVRLSFPQVEGYRYQSEHILSPDGHCRAFDAKGQGTIFSDGIGIVVLKRLDEALEDSDTIHAVILGTAVNNDGISKLGFTAPSVEGQSNVISMAHAAAQITPETIGYVECHGTGTALGDPIEIEALSRAFRKGTDLKHFCAIGSAKTNMGHLDTAAGVAGLIKTALMLKHRQLVPSLHFEEPNPAIDFKNAPFYVNTHLKNWDSAESRRAGVSAFGIGGTNVHVVLQEPPQISQAESSEGPYLLCVSGKTEHAANVQAQQLGQTLKDGSDRDLNDVAFTLCSGRWRFNHRRALVVSQTQEISADPQAWLRGVATSKAKPLVFLFPGQGSQRIGVGHQLYRYSETFRTTLDTCFDQLTPLLDLNLKELMFKQNPTDADHDTFAQTQYAQPALFVLSYGLATLWQSWGLVPKALLGHSIGEYVAACLAGVFSLEEALSLVVARGACMAKAPTGGMLAVGCSPETIRERLPEGLDLAVVNSPERCVVAGPWELLKALEAELGKDTISCTRLKTSHGFHSRAMDAALPAFRTALQAVTFSKPSIPMVSNLTGTWLTDEQATDPDYWCQQLRQTVRFDLCLATLLEDSGHSFLEIGPGKTLTGFLRACLEKHKDIFCTASLSSNKKAEPEALCQTLGLLWCHGVAPNPFAYATATGRRIPLPTYPFEKQPYSFTSGEHAMAETAATTQAPQEPQFVAYDHVESALLEILAKMLDEPAASIDTGLPFLEMGADSLILVELVQRVENLFGVDVSVRQFFEEVDTLQLLAHFVSDHMPDSHLQALIQECQQDQKQQAAPSTPVMSNPLPQTSVLAAEPPLSQEQTARNAIEPPDQGNQPVTTPIMQPLPLKHPTQLQQPIADGSVQSVIQQQLATMQQIFSQQLSSLGRVPSAQPQPGTPIQPPTAGKVQAPVGTSQIVQSNSATEPKADLPAVPQDIRATKKSRYAPLSVTEKRYRGLDDNQKQYLESLIEAFNQRTATSKDLTQKFRPVLADNRASAGFRFSTKEMLYPILGERSLGSRLWDIDGNEYVDIAMGFGVDFFGHSPEFLSHALEAQLEMGNQLGPQCRLAGEVAELLKDITGKERFTFCNTGTESVMIAIRLARAHTGRNKIALFNGSFHGQYDSTLATAKPGSGDPRAIPIVPGITPNTVSDILVVDYGVPESLEILKKHAHEIAAVVVEPIQSDRPDIQPKAFLHQLRSLTSETGMVLIFDEMITGFRLHQRGAQGFFEVEADMCTYGKVVGGGMPIGIVAGPPELMDRIDGGMWAYGDVSYPSVATTFFAGTFSKLPMTMAVCKAVLLELKQQGPQLQETLNAKTAAFCHDLNQFFQAHRLPLTMVHAGSLFRFAFATNLDLMFYQMLMDGVYIWEGRNCFFSTAHTDQDIQYVSQTIKTSLARLQQAGFLKDSLTIETQPPLAFPVGSFQAFRAFQSQQHQVSNLETKLTLQGTTSLKQRTYPAPDPSKPGLYFSLSFFGKYEKEFRGDKYDLLMNSARYADSHDFHAIWVPERHFHPFGGFSPNPSVISAALARETQRVRLQAGSVVLPLHHPIRITEEWAAVDNLSRGRVGIAFASGWHPDDFVFAPNAFGKHRDQTFEGLQQVMRLWRGDTLIVPNGKGNPLEATIYPMPQQAELPVALTIVSNPDTYAKAGELGVGVLTNLMGQSPEELGNHIQIYRDALAKAGHPSHIGKVTVLLHTYLHQDPEMARETARQPFYEYLSSSLGLFKTLAKNMGFQYDFDKLKDADRKFLLEKAYERYVQTSALIGNLETCEPIAAKLMDLGVDEIACFVDFGISAPLVEASYPLLNDLRCKFKDPSTPPTDPEKKKFKPTDSLTSGSSGSVNVGQRPSGKIVKTFPLSQAQQQIWNVSQLSKAFSVAYQIRVHLRLEGPFQPKAMQSAFQKLVDHHEALRICFDESGSQQYVWDQVVVDLPLIDQSSESPSAVARFIEEWIVQDNQTAFDLVSGPLIRGVIIAEAAQTHHLLLTTSHLVTDGWSSGVMLDDLSKLYLAACENREAELPEPMAFSEFLTHAQSPGHLEKQQPAKAYWLKQFQSNIPVLNLPFDKVPANVRTYAGRRTTRRLPAESMRTIRKLSRQSGVTPFMTLFATYLLLLHRLTNQEELVVGIPVGGRPFPGSDHLVGYCTHLLPIRHLLTGTPNRAQWLKTIRQQLSRSYENQDYPYADLLEALRSHHDLSQTPLVTAIFNLERRLPPQDLGPLKSHIVDQPIAWVAFDINLNLTETTDGLILDFDFSTELLSNEFADCFLNCYLQLLNAMITQDQTCVLDWPLMATQEIKKGFPKPYPLPASPNFADCFAAQVAKTPAAPAASFEHQTLSYQELNERANALAAKLQAKGIARERLVPILADRNLDFLISILALFKCGAAYLPLDPAHPPARFQQILSQTRSQWIFVAPPYKQALKQATATLDWQPECIEVQPSQECLEHFEHARVSDDQLAYVIFTSGSTGLPKGAMVHQKGMVNHIFAKIVDLKLTAQDRIIQNASQCFDISVWQFLAPLLCGGMVRIVSNDVARHPKALWQEVRDHHITVLEVVPSYMRVFLEEGLALGFNKEALKLHCLMATGEALPPHLCSQWLETFQRTYVMNAYGPTECSDDVTHYAALEPPEQDLVNMPIGSPILNTHLYVVDRRCRLVPDGIPGELLVGGYGVGRGYFQNPVRTAPVFIPDCLSGLPGSRLYRTGDLVRRLPNGQLEFMGRLDHQVKIRGFRIELGEIEAVFRRYDGVKQALVIDQTDPSGHKRLVAYVTSQSSETNQTPVKPIEEHQLIDFASRHLPEYMVPSVVLHLEAFPLTANGKIDRKALPKPNYERTLVLPRNAVEQALVDIWASVLGLETLSITDNFFTLGGDSILALQVMSRAQRAGFQLTPNQLFENQTISQLASVATQQETLEIDQGPVLGDSWLTPVQQDFFNANHPNPNYYNLSVLLECHQPVAIDHLEQALAALVSHHDALRLSFNQESSPPSLHHRELDAPQLFGLTELKQVALQEVETHVQANQRCLVLNKGPLLSALLMHRSDGTQALHLAVHHLVIDGLSWRILLEDLDTLLAQAESQQPFALPPKTTSWQQWSRRLEAWSRTAACQTQKAYWQAQNQKPVHDWAGDLPKGNSTGTQRITKRLSTTQTAQLLREAPVAYRTQINDLLLTALVRTLTQNSQVPAIRIDFEHHGRATHLSQIDHSRTIGWFTAIYPAVLSADAGLNLGSQIKAIKEQLRTIPNHGLSFGLLKHQLQPVPQTLLSFNYLGQIDQSLGERFSLSDQFPGDEQDPTTPPQHALQLDALVKDGELQFHWIFDSKRFATSGIEQLASHFQSQVVDIIEHCLLPDSRGVTPSDFPLATLQQQALDNHCQQWAIPDAIYSLTPMQRGMLFHTKANPTSRVYIEQVSALLKGNIEKESFWNCWLHLAQRHQALRSRFLLDDQQDMQWVMPKAALPQVELDWRHLTPNEQNERLTAFRDEDLDHRFEPELAPPYRLTLIQLDSDRFFFCFTFHHVMLDGWSLQILFAEFSQRFTNKHQNISTQPKASYAQYMRWLQNQDMTKASTYWQELLCDFETPNRILPTHTADPQLPEQAFFDLVYTESESQDLERFARQCGVTLNTLFQAAWSIILSKYSNQEDVVFGVTVSGRPPSVPDADQLVGLFINTLPTCINTKGHQSLKSWLKTIQAQQASSREFEFSALSDIQKFAQIGQGQPLFETLLVFENYPVSASLNEGWAGLEIEQAFVYEQVNYPICLLVTPGETIFTKIRFNPRQVPSDFIEKLSHTLSRVLQRMCGLADGTLANISLASAEDQELILNTWHPPETQWADHIRMDQAFSLQACKTPHHPAVIFENQALSYLELEHHSNQLAHWLISQGVDLEIPVGLFLTRSLEMVTAILGVLKAGGAYVPLDPDHPADRLSYVLEDSKASFILTLSNLEKALPNTSAQVVPLDHPEHPWRQASVQALSTPTCLDAAAYVIYTSGTTGKPKPVCNSHRGIMNRLNWMRHQFKLEPEDRVMQKTPYSFDISIWEFFWPIMNGATLVLAKPGGHKDPDYLNQLIASQKVSMIHFVPSMLEAFLGFIDTKALNSIKQIFCSGEALPGDLIAKCHDFLPVPIHNLYGPTEAAIEVTHFECSPNHGNSQPPIGRPLTNTQMVVLDRSGHLCPVGNPGELMIGGVQVARGYPGRAALTASKFIPNPFSKTPGGRLYRTGDLARWSKQGTIDYLGRLDHQVKIRGYRIELSEIDVRLRQLPDLQDAVVVAREDSHNHKRLVGYVVMNDGSAFKASELEKELLVELPDYMVPRLWVTMEALPVSPNGKLDRNALPEPEQHLVTKNFQAPQGKTEVALAAVWQEVLGLEAIDRYANFFQLGGDSILSLQVVSKAARLGLRVTLTQLFSHPSIASLAEVAVRKTPQTQASKPSIGRVAATPIQRWFFEQARTCPNHFNQSVLLNPKQKLEPEALKQALKTICFHHDVCRLKVDENKELSFMPSDHVGIGFSHELSPCLEETPSNEWFLERANHVQASLNLQAGNAGQMCLFEMPDGSQRLLWVLHHLIVDGVSWRFLIEDLETALASPNLELPPKTSSWQQWAHQLASQATIFEADLEYWQNVSKTKAILTKKELTATTPHTSLVAPSKQDLGKVQTATAILDTTTTQQLLGSLSNRYQTQVDDLLLTALSRSLLEPGDEVRIETEGHGREDLFEELDVSRTLGWFTSLFPVVLEYPENLNLIDHLKHIKELRRQIPSKGLSWGVLRYLHPQGPTQLASGEKAQVIFNYLGQFDQTMEQSELFDLSDTAHGDASSPQDPPTHPLNFECLVLNQQLHVYVNFNQQNFEKDSMHLLAKNFVEHLKSLVIALEADEKGGFTPSDFPNAALSQSQLDRYCAKAETIGLQHNSALPITQILEDLYPMTASQAGMLFHQNFEQDSQDYIEQMEACFVGQFEETRFVQAWETIIENHPILRTLFSLDDQLQMVLALPTHSWTQLDWQSLTENAAQQALLELKLALRRNPFQLDSQVPLKFHLVKLSKDKTVFLWTFHHALLDGWSIQNILGQLSQLYKNPEKTQLPSVRPFRDFVTWQMAQSGPEADSFWHSYLAGFDQPNQLQTRRLADMPKGQHTQLDGLLTESQSNHLRQWAKENNLTLNTAFQAAWALLLTQVFASEDVVTGITTAGRPPELAGVDAMVGLMINTLPLHIQCSKDLTKAAFLNQVQHQASCQLPFMGSTANSIQKAIHWQGGKPLFESLLVFENYPLDPHIGDAWPNLDITHVALHEKANYPLAMVVIPDSAIVCKLVYQTNQLPKEVALRMLSQLPVLLDWLTSKPKETLASCPKLSENAFVTGLTAPLPAQQIHQIFEQFAHNTPHQPALFYEGETWTYEQLNSRANQIAGQLAQCLFPPASVIGVCASRHPLWIVAMLGILKAGHCYLPLDPGYPTPRLQFMLANSQAKLVFYLGDEAPFETQTNIHVENAATFGSDHAETNLNRAIAANQNAYVIYTSGSTGQPKGVMVPHRGIPNMVLSQIKTFGLTPEDRVLQYASPSFDAAISEMFLALASGATLYLAPSETIAPGLPVTKYLNQHQISNVTLTPTVLATVPLGEVPSLRSLIVAGEAAPAGLLAQWAAHCRVFNAYGPTENTVCATIHTCNTETALPPIGSPIHNQQLLVLDRALRPVPQGMVGQLFLAGPGLASGYLGKPALTASHFLPLANTTTKGARMYATGDLCAVNPMAQLEFFGRVDHQVKINGIRIETGEIATTLQQLPLVSEAFVTVRHMSGRDRLVAYFTSESAIEPAQVRQFASETLPQSMVPSAFLPIESWPLTPNGKLDSKALPLPNFEAQSQAQPRTALEQKLAVVWSEVLAVNDIGIHDNFFELGGDSITSIQVVSKANQSHLFFTPKQLFSHPTIAQLALVVSEKAAIQASQETISGSGRLSPIQMWFFNQPRKNPHQFNQSLWLSHQPALKIEDLVKALQRLVAHHDGLRQVFEHHNGDWVAKIKKPSDHLFMSWETAAARSRVELEHLAQKAQQQLNITDGPMMHMVHVPSKNLLFLTIHHLVVDAVSWQILLEDLELLLQSPTNQLPPKTSSWLDWSQALETHAESLELPALWKTAVPKDLVTLEPDHAEGVNSNQNSRVLSINIPAKETQNLLGPALNAYRTKADEFMIAALLHALANQPSGGHFLLDLERHGRQVPFEQLDLTRTVGWFTNLYPTLLALPNAETSLPSLIKTTKEQLRKFEEHSFDYSVAHYLTPEDLGCEWPQASMSFNYLGQLDRLTAESGSIQLKNLPTGDEHATMDQRGHLVEINAFVLNGSLQIDVQYSGAHFKGLTISNLANRFKQSLQTLLSHCLTPGIGSFTTSDFPLSHLEQSALETLEQNHPNLQDIYPMTPLQQGMLFHSSLSPDSGVYMEQLAADMIGDLNVEAMKAAWHWVAKRHAVLRTLFDTTQGLQIVLPGETIAFQQYDWTHLAPQEHLSRLDRFKRDDLFKAFNPSQKPAWRLQLIQLNQRHHHLVFTFHHALLDGWSLPTLLTEISYAYGAYCHGQLPRMAPPPAFKNYIQWLNHQDRQQAVAFWTGYLKGFSTPNQIVGSPIPSQSAYGESNIQLSPRLSTAIKTWSKQEELTLNTLFQAAWGYLVSRYSNAQDVVFGVTGSGRPPGLPGVENMVGMFLSTLPVRLKIDPTMRVIDWLKGLQNDQAAAREFEFTGLTDIQLASDVPSGTDLFETLLVFENYPVEASMKGDWADLSTTQASLHEQVNYPLCLEISPGSKVAIKLRLDTTRISEQKGNELLAHLELILMAMVSQQTETLDELPQVLPKHLTQMNLWNQTNAAYPMTACFHHCFEAQVSSQPDRIAVEDSLETLTYHQLNQRANLLANQLIDKHIGPEDLVAILADRSALFLTAMLGIFKAGGAYLPLDPAWPKGRLQQIVAQSGAKAVLTETHYQDRLATLDIALPECLPLSRATPSQPIANPVVPVTHQHKAYVIFTSGSTGTPKGATLQHGGMLNHLIAKVDDLDIHQDDLVVQNASQCFDISIWQFLVALLKGGQTLVVTGDTAKDPTALVDMLAAKQVTVFETVPSMLRAMCGSLKTMAKAPALQELRWMVATGEALPPDLVAQWFELYPSIPMMNAYGPTECSDDVTHAIIKEPLPPSVVHTPIGQLLNNTTAFIVDTHNQPVPLGVAGELLIGGHGLGRGYLGDPVKTALAFIPHPHTSEPGQRLYRTGDLTRFEANGEITYLGRLDHQVKIRGFRIELGEIEAVLTGHDHLKEAIVTVYEKNSQKSLWAYVVTNANQGLDGDGLKTYMREFLPTYMIPNIMFLESFPLTANGKIDRKALPEPHVVRETDSARLPETAIEKACQALWQTLFEQEDIHLEDNFFDLGGHSLLAVRLVHQASETFQLQLPLSAIFQAPTLGAFSHMIEETKQTTSLFQSPTPLVPLQPEGNKPPFYCVHPMGGVVHVYMGLAKQVGTQQPFYGLQQQGIDGESEPLTDVIEMAKSYVDAIRQHQPKGPYYLGGWSLGGVIAYEMARQFRAMGEDIGLLLIMDTIIHKPGKGAVDGYFDYSFWLEFYAVQLELMFDKKLGIKRRKLSKLTQNEQINLVVEKAISKGIFKTKAYGIKQFENFMRVTHTGLKAVSSYNQSGFDGDITLLRCKDDISPLHHINKDVRTAGWRHYTSGEVSVHLVSGDHRTMIQQPHVQEVAKVLCDSANKHLKTKRS